MKNMILIAAVVFGIYYFYSMKDSVESVANGIYFDGKDITYNGEEFKSEWTTGSNKIEGYVRMIESDFDKNMPIITTTFVITTGDYSDPTLVQIEKRNRGYLLYQLNPQQKLRGTITIYHIIPSDANVQNQLSSVMQGDSVSMMARISTSGELMGEKGILKMSVYIPNEHMHTKMDVDNNNTSTSQLILFVESVSKL